MRSDGSQDALREGPLAGLRVVEMAGLGPAPFCATMLADHGAEVIRIDRAGAGIGIAGDPARDVLCRSRVNVSLDLKTREGVDTLKRLCASADGLIEGFRPGVMERLGLGPEVLLGDNPRLVYGRMTGWGQTGPLAGAAGHDINYIALSGALHACGRATGGPVPPLNLVGDFGGGGMLLAFGMLAAILRAQRTGRGQVVDCAMTDGSAMLMAMIYSLRAAGRWTDARGSNFLDGAAPYYDTYETADGGYIAIGPIEPQFHALLLDKLGLASDSAFAIQDDQAAWPRRKERLAALFRTRSRDEWCGLLEGTDACFAPVLSMAEAPAHPHNVARGTFATVDGIVQPAPAPRYSESGVTAPGMLRRQGAGVPAWRDLSASKIDDLDRAGAAGVIG